MRLTADKTSVEVRNASAEEDQWAVQTAERLLKGYTADWHNGGEGQFNVKAANGVLQVSPGPKFNFPNGSEIKAEVQDLLSGSGEADLEEYTVKVTGFKDR